MANPKI